MSFPTDAIEAQDSTAPMRQNSAASPAASRLAQTTQELMMVRPINFGSNPETALDNAFQAIPAAGQAASIAAKAQLEFDTFVAKLRAAGVKVLVVEDTPQPVKTDAVFPNNWITTHEDGLLVIYPMHSAIRQQERRQDVLALLAERYGYTKLIDLSEWENTADKMLEGTGSMILDRPNRLAFACLSQRTTQAAFEEWAQLMGYEAVAFHAVDTVGTPIYHTNVMMAIGSTHAVICLAAIPDIAQREWVVAKIEASGRSILPISQAQMGQFAGNMLEVKGEQASYWVMSASAYHALEPAQLEALQQHGQQILYSDLSTIETYGGGSARCMLAELFVPKP